MVPEGLPFGFGSVYTHHLLKQLPEIRFLEFDVLFELFHTNKPFGPEFACEKEYSSNIIDHAKFLIANKISLHRLESFGKQISQRKGWNMIVLDVLLLGLRLRHDKWLNAMVAYHKAICLRIVLSGCTV